MSQPVAEWSDEQICRVISEHLYHGQFWRNDYCDLIADPAMVLMLLEKLFVAVDTETTLETLGEDQFITMMRNLWHRINRKIDGGTPFQVLFGRFIALAYIQANGLERK